MSNSFKIRQHIFPVRTKIFLGEASLPPGCGSVDFCTSQKNKRFLAYFMRILNSCVVQ